MGVAEQAELQSLINDHSDMANARKIELADSMATKMFDLPDEVQRRGHSGAELKQAADGLRTFAHDEAQALNERRTSLGLAEWLVNGKPYTAPST